MQCLSIHLSYEFYTCIVIHQHWLHSKEWFHYETGIPFRIRKRSNCYTTSLCNSAFERKTKLTY